MDPQGGISRFVASTGKPGAKPAPARNNSASSVSSSSSSSAAPQSKSRTRTKPKRTQSSSSSSGGEGDSDASQSAAAAAPSAPVSSATATPSATSKAKSKSFRLPQPIPNSVPAAKPSAAQSGTHVESGTETSSETERRRKTSHLLLETMNGEWFIVSSLSTRNDTQAIHIHPQTGELQFHGQRGRDLFANENEAVMQIKEVHGPMVKTAMRVEALLGYIAFQGVAYLIVATKVRRDMRLPGGHSVYTIAEAKWVRVELFFLCAQPKAEARNVEIMQEFPLEGLHYYCETYDITRPFPSSYPVHQHHEAFCWNDWLASSFALIGLRSWCVVLLQGVALSKCIALDNTKSNVELCAITRKSRINPGTRYFARGLNKFGGPGNECECELIMWMGTTEMSWRSFIWRRGTVPIWWKSEMTVGESKVIIDPNHPFKGAHKYYERILERYGPTPLYILNMLRCGAGQDEATLTEYFEKSLEHIMRVVNLEAKMIKFDWHHNLKQMGSQKAIETMWGQTKPVMQKIGLNSGHISFLAPELGGARKKGTRGSGSRGDADQEDPGCRCPNGTFMYHLSHTTQLGILRFNCADSLDRTNVATFFHALQVCAEMCRQFGIMVESEDVQEWGYFDMELPTVVNRMPRSILGPLTEFFVFNGDVLSVLYTNSPAMHSSVMRDYSPNVSSARHNAIIALQRRYQNVIKDNARQAQYNMLLGLKLSKYFPSIAEQPQLKCVSRFPAFCLKDVPCVFKSLRPEHLVLSDQRQHEPYCWICPKGYDIIELYILLQQPCLLTEFSLTLVSGAGEASHGQLLDVFIGTYLDTLRIVYQGLLIPRCTAATKIYYTIPTDMWRAYEGPSIYDFGDAQPPSSFTRVVQFRFRGIPGGHMTIGKIELFGILPQDVHASADASVLAQKKKETTLKAKQILAALDTSNDPAILLENDRAPTTFYPGEIEGDTFMHSPRTSASMSWAEQELIAETSTIENELFGGGPNSPAHKGLMALGGAGHSSSFGIDGMLKSDAGGGLGMIGVGAKAGDMFGIRPAFQGEDTLGTPFLSQEIDDASEEESEEHRLMNEREMKRRQDIYTESVRNLLATSHGKNLDFTDTLELEYLRLSLNLTATQRDQILLDLDQHIASFNPCRFVYLRDEKAEASLRKSSKYRSNTCATSGCKNSLGFFSQQQCHYCRRRYCSNCMAPQPYKIIEFQWEKPQPVCKRCRRKLVRQSDLIIRIKEETKKIALLCPKEEDIRMKMLLWAVERNQGHWHEQASEEHTRAVASSSASSYFGKRKTRPIPHIQSLAEYPNAAILLSVLTKASAAPVESILLPVGEGLAWERLRWRCDPYWAAPPGISSAEILVVLACDSLVHSFGILVDDLGYSGRDTPTITVLAGKTIPNWASLGTWNLAHYSTTSEDSGEIRPREYLEFSFSRPFECRLLSFKISLPSREGNSASNPETAKEKASEPTRTEEASPEEEQAGKKKKKKRSNKQPGQPQQPSAPAQSPKPKTTFLHLGRLKIFGEKVYRPPTTSTALIQKQKAKERERSAQKLTRQSSAPGTSRLGGDEARSALSVSGEVPTKRDKEALNNSGGNTSAFGFLPFISSPGSTEDGSNQDKPIVSAFARFAQSLSLESSASVASLRQSSQRPITDASNAATSSTPTTPSTSSAGSSFAAGGSGSFINFTASSPFSPQASPGVTIPASDLPLIGQDRALYDSVMGTPVPKSYNQLKPVWSQYRNGKQAIDICVDPAVPVSGFVVLTRHGEEGVASQVQLMRIIAITTESKGEMHSLRPVGRFIIPKTRPKTLLCYECSFPPQVNILSFQFLSNYGGRETQPPKIYLFNSDE